jgi:glycine/D-amino acid oxidase-like deaminating enzyme
MDNLLENYSAISHWLQNIREPIQPRESLSGDHRARVAIVGAGYSGLWTAYYLKKLDPSLEIMIVESSFAGRGAAGRNGGWCSYHLPNFSVLAENSATRDGAKQILPHLFEMVDEVGRITELEGIDCDYHKGGTVHVAITKTQQQALLEELELFEQLGFGKDQVWLDRTSMDKKIRMANSLGGIFSPHCAVVDPAKLVRGLAEVVERLGVRIFEQSPVTSISRGMVKTADGSISADKIVLASEGYTNQHKGLPKNRFLPVHTFMAVTEPLPETVFDEIGLSDREAFADGRALVTYGQRTIDNRIAFGYGARTYLNGKPRDFFNSQAEEFQTIKRIIGQLFPILADAEYSQCWGGAMAMSRTQRAFAHYDIAAGVGWLGGFLGNGVAATNLGGRAMTDLILDRDTELTELSLLVIKAGSPLTQYRSWEWGPISWSASNTMLKKMRYQDKRDTGI